ncbi:hypothetical protein SJAG_06013 [Schizosaccharomyces japonicus yFS275]|uniref:Uncharacterized protein n=1 Tax=Schizosaccharomyces japonicus (strain yFS275 / FY16936) TaxID=402676 RepID=T0S353_SCHJY|nr:hypothetical protein SJAG_06013 [Schizosaccharomyces japonicus yFS275]EQC53056.1 hypothetical protein SJAG_06013 [Schizosaccharomyces japonicus yFS275]
MTRGLAHPGVMCGKGEEDRRRAGCRGREAIRSTSNWTATQLQLQLQLQPQNYSDSFNCRFHCNYNYNYGGRFCCALLSLASITSASVCSTIPF